MSPERFLPWLKTAFDLRLARTAPGLIFFVLVSSCTAPEPAGPHFISAIQIGPHAPADITGGAEQASMKDAAKFAWSQFIALNWPAVKQDGSLPSRGVPAKRVPNGDENGHRPRAWQTYRAKTEIFPGIGEPHGFKAGDAADFGFDQPPFYRYDPASVGSYPGLKPGVVPACHEEQSSNPPPWIELSESHEVGPEKMYAGIVPVVPGDDPAARQRVQYGVKVDRNFYRYVAARGWLDGGNEGSIIPASATEKYIATHHASPPPGGSQWVAFPESTVQIKSAWRKLTDSENTSGRFLTAMARSYLSQDPEQTYNDQKGNPDYPCFVDATWGLVGMHVKTRTPSAPYYIWATFEQADNITARNGEFIENEDGSVVLDSGLPPTDPLITAINAVAADPQTPRTIQRMSPAVAHADPGQRLYYENLSGTPTTQGKIAVNGRVHPIPQPVIDVNREAHQALRQYLDESPENRRLVEPALKHYKLVGVQWRPANKPRPGIDVVDDPDEPNEVLRYPAAYYLSNIMLETSYRLQHFSGKVQRALPPPNQDLDTQDLVTDFYGNGQPVKNVMYAGQKPDGHNAGFNMGGCMGCHGQIQIKGYDFSFIFRRGRINAPEVGESIRLPLSNMVYPPAGGE